jgi:hypothetical protein
VPSCGSESGSSLILPYRPVYHVFYDLRSLPVGNTTLRL